MENCNYDQHNHLIPVLHDFLHFLNIFYLNNLRYSSEVKKRQ